MPIWMERSQGEMLRIRETEQGVELPTWMGKVEDDISITALKTYSAVPAKMRERAEGEDAFELPCREEHPVQVDKFENEPMPVKIRINSDNTARDLSSDVPLYRQSPAIAAGQQRQVQIRVKSGDKDLLVVEAGGDVKITVEVNDVETLVSINKGWDKQAASAAPAGKDAADGTADLVELKPEPKESSTKVGNIATKRDDVKNAARRIGPKKDENISKQAVAITEMEPDNFREVTTRERSTWDQAGENRDNNNKVLRVYRKFVKPKKKEERRKRIAELIECGLS